MRIACFSIIAVTALWPALSVTFAQTEPVTKPSDSGGEAVLTIGDLTDGIAARAQAIGPRTGSITETWYSVLDSSQPIRQKSFAFTESEGRLRFESRLLGPNLKPLQKGRQTSAWNGRELTILTERPEAPPERRFGGVIGGEPPDPSSYYWRTLVENAFLTCPEPLAQLVGRGFWKPLGVKQHGAYRGFGLTTARALDEYPDHEFEAWVAPEQGLAPVRARVARYRRGKLIFEAVLDNVRLEQRDGNWIMSEARVTLANHPADPESPDVVFVYELGDFKRHPAVREEDFTLRFPVGARVYDGIEKMSFIAGKAVFVQNAEGAHTLVPITRFPQYEARTDHTRGLTAEELEKLATVVDGRSPGTQPVRRETVPSHHAASGYPRWQNLIAIGIGFALILVGLWVFKTRGARKV